MSSPPLKTPASVRWLSILVVIVAIVVRFWPHAPVTPARPASSGGLTTAVVAPAAHAPAVAAPEAVPHFDATIGFRSREQFEEHVQKHGREVGAATAADYLRLAQSLRDRPVGGDVRELVRADGVVCRFDRGTGAFLAFNADGTIRTFFRPNDGERYFERQAARPRGTP